MLASGRPGHWPGSVSKLFFPVAIALLLAACAERKPKTLGASFNGTPIQIAALKQSNVAATVVVHGAMTEKCPVAGCWFILHDQTGAIKVDTKNAGFVVVDIPLHSSLMVAGRLLTNGGEKFIDATGLRY